MLSSLVPLIDDLLAKTYALPSFICDPFVARGGVTLLHGRKSLGKSPFSWEIARCTANGLPFLGHPTSKSRVLFIEKDTSEQLSMARIRKLPEPRGGWYAEFPLQIPFDLGAGRPKYLLEREAEWGPFDFVIWNPLARMYNGTDRDVVKRVYDNMASIFPQAGHLLVSHDRKEGRSADAITIDSEEHSGWQEWVNLAQNVFRLVRPERFLELRHTGSQTGQLIKPVRFVLTCDNSSIAPYHRVDNVTALVEAAPGATLTEKVQHVAQTQQKSESTVWRALKDEKSDSNSEIA